MTVGKLQNLNGIIQCSEKDKNSEIGLANFKPEAYLINNIVKEPGIG